MILYPTETIYALGVNALDAAAMDMLCQCKGREAGKSVSWLVRDVADIERWGVLSETAAKIAEQFLPGPLTLVLPPKESVPEYRRKTGEVSFRISPDPVAQQLIHEYMTEHDAPLTCTSANVSGLEPQSTVDAILEQFTSAGKDLRLVNRIIDDEARSGLPSTVVRVIGDQIDIVREGAIAADAILSVRK